MIITKIALTPVILLINDTHTNDARTHDAFNNL